MVSIDKKNVQALYIDINFLLMFTNRAYIKINNVDVVLSFEKNIIAQIYLLRQMVTA